MKIRQILNNNIALVQRGDIDVIVISNGISFRKKTGDSINLDEVDKVFVPDSEDVLETYSYLLSHVESTTLHAVSNIISYAECHLNEKANAYLYLTLLDHIDYALKRAAKKQFIVSPLAWEVRKFYPKEYAVAKKALTILKEETHVEFPESEAVSIALHLINLQETKVNIDETMLIMEAVRDMLTIIRIYFKIEFEEDSMNYNRLVTHLQYFAQRLSTNDYYCSEDDELNTQVRNMYPDAYLCVIKIAHYLKERFQKEISRDEETYLMLHIHRITQRKERS